jgi:hypothetical protein
MIDTIRVMSAKPSGMCPCGAIRPIGYVAVETAPGFSVTASVHADRVTWGGEISIGKDIEPALTRKIRAEWLRRVAKGWGLKLEVKDHE